MNLFIIEQNLNLIGLGIFTVHYEGTVPKLKITRQNFSGKSSKKLLGD